MAVLLVVSFSAPGTAAAGDHPIIGTWNGKNKFVSGKEHDVTWKFVKDGTYTLISMIGTSIFEDSRKYKIIDKNTIEVEFIDLGGKVVPTKGVLEFQDDRLTMKFQGQTNVYSLTRDKGK
jgi:hypothetical protein